MPYSPNCLEGKFSETGSFRYSRFSETEGMYMYLALNKSGSGAYHRYKSTLVPFSENLLGR
jgi:hypothetical protein